MNYDELEKVMKKEGYTDEEIKEQIKDLMESDLEWAKEEAEEYSKLHYKKCKKCGKTMSDVAPNGAGILEQLDGFSCDFCGYEESEDK